MKIKILIFALFCIIAIVLFLFYNKEKEVIQLKNQLAVSPTQTTQKAPKESNTYTNNRFDYAIDYPVDWPVGEEATNNDGRNLYKYPDTEILVYGSNIPSRFPEQDDPGVEQTSLLLNDGRKATLLKLAGKDGKMKYVVFFVQEGVQYTFFVNVPRDFFEQNEKNIEASAKSFRLLK